MSTKEKAMAILEHMTEEQLQGFLMLFQDLVNASSIPEEEPDAWDKALIADSKTDNGESMPLDDFVREMGFDPDALRD